MPGVEHPTASSASEPEPSADPARGLDRRPRGVDPDAVQARRRPRSRLIPIVLLAAGAAGLLAAIISLSVGERGPQAFTVEGSGDVQRLFGGLDQSGNELGDPGAPVTISVFNDLQCPSCADYQLATVPPLIEDLVRRDRARLELRHFSVGPATTSLAAVGATAAGEQGTQWQFAHLFFVNQDEVPEQGVDEDFLEEVAAAIPGPEFDVPQWRRDFEASSAERRVRADAEVATNLRFPAEPAVVVEGPAGSERLIESPSVAEIQAAAREVR